MASALPGASRRVGFRSALKTATLVADLRGTAAESIGMSANGVLCDATLWAVDAESNRSTMQEIWLGWAAGLATGGTTILRVHQVVAGAMPWR